MKAPYQNKTIAIIELKLHQNIRCTFILRRVFSDFAIPINVTITNVMPIAFTVSWNPIPGAINYEVVATPADRIYTARMSSGASTTQIITSLEPGVYYNVTVRANYTAGNSLNSEVVRQITGKVLY